MIPVATDHTANVVDGYLREGRPASPLESLGRRELEVVQLVVEGKTSAEIGALLALSPKTVETYRSRVMQKLGVTDVPGLVKFAIQHGLPEPLALRLIQLTLIVVTMSIFLHGISVKPLMAHVWRRGKRSKLP